jgi:hypothetical protein
MTNDTYKINIDKLSGRAYVEAEGIISASIVRNTFLVIAINGTWQKGDKSILWRTARATFSESFEFGNIFQTARISKTAARSGKSAIVVNYTSEMIKMVADYYKALALLSTPRKIEIFFSNEEAMRWLDT